MQPTLDNQQCWKEPLGKMREEQPKPSLLDHLEDPPVLLNPESKSEGTQYHLPQQIPRKTSSELVSSQRWTTSSGISGKTRPHEWKHSTKFYKYCMKPMSVNQFGRQLLNNTPSMSTSLRPNKRELYNKDYKPSGETVKKNPQLELPMFWSSIGLLKAVNQTQEEMQNNSYESSEGTFSTSNKDEAYQVLPVQRVIQKPQRIYQSQLPWYTTKVEAQAKELDENRKRMRDALATIQKDLVFTEREIRRATSAPQAFPESEWRHIFKGEAVNLDVIFSSLHHIAPPKENVGRVGSTEISLGKSDPVRKVQTSGDWTVAWHAASKATSYVFPHRAEELWQWGDYMASEFSAKHVNAHYKLIAFNRAIWSTVGGGQSILLTNREQFTYLYSAYLLPDGIQGGSSSRFTTGDHSLTLYVSDGKFSWSASDSLSSLLGEAEGSVRVSDLPPYISFLFGNWNYSRSRQRWCNGEDVVLHLSTALHVSRRVPFSLGRAFGAVCLACFLATYRTAEVFV
ncbi:hypothetical protein L208DRAFT_1506323 [Tricholoma matsutake]|nr:hypothetical protein L208DRAFT_1506323 [Tricholoma matsutake 945]